MGQRQPAQQQFDVVAGVEALHQAQASAQTELIPHRIGATVLLAPIGLARVFHLAGKHPVPVDAGHHGPHLDGR